MLKYLKANKLLKNRKGYLMSRKKYVSTIQAKLNKHNTLRNTILNKHNSGCACKHKVFLSFFCHLVEDMFAYSLLIYSAAKVIVDWAVTAEGHHSSAKCPLKHITLMIPFLTPFQRKEKEMTPKGHSLTQIAWLERGVKKVCLNKPKSWNSYILKNLHLILIKKI